MVVLKIVDTFATVLLMTNNQSNLFVKQIECKRKIRKPLFAIKSDVNCCGKYIVNLKIFIFWPVSLRRIKLIYKGNKSGHTLMNIDHLIFGGGVVFFIYHSKS